MNEQQQLEMAQNMANVQKGLGPILAIYGLIFIISIVALWKLFTKAGKPGWASIVPIYNLIVLLEIAGKPTWWIVLMLIPFVNFIIAIILFIALAEAFGKGAGFGIGLAFLGIIFLPILAFGSAQYRGAPSPKPATA
jgi:hypothetical protein